MWDISFDNITHFALVGYIGEHLYGYVYQNFRNQISLIADSQYDSWGIFLIKLSLLLLYWDLFAMSANYKRAILGVGIPTLLSTVANMTAITFQCKPVNFWTDLLHMKCFHKVSLIAGNLCFFGSWFLELY